MRKQISNLEFPVSSFPTVTHKKRESKHSNERGFTMVELILYMGIFSMLLLMLTQIFGVILSVKSESQATSSVAQDGSYILSRLSYDIRRASTVVAPARGVSSSSLRISGTGLDETYFLQGDQLVITNNNTATTDAVSSSNTSAQVTFTTLGNTDTGSKLSVKVVLTLTSKIARDGIRKQVFETTVQTR